MGEAVVVEEALDGRFQKISPTGARSNPRSKMPLGDYVLKKTKKTDDPSDHHGGINTMDKVTERLERAHRRNGGEQGISELLMYE